MWPFKKKKWPDGCSYAPDSLIVVPIFRRLFSLFLCCVEHDLGYKEWWLSNNTRGGTESDRLFHDLKLAHCIANTGPEWIRWWAKQVAITYYLRVRRFGRSSYVYRPGEKPA